MLNFKQFLVHFLLLCVNLTVLLLSLFILSKDQNSIGYKFTEEKSQNTSSVLQSIDSNTSNSVNNKSIKVDWNDKIIQIPDNFSGLNIFNGLKKSVAQNPSYINNLKKINPKVVRFHYSRLLEDEDKYVKGWMDNSNQTWSYNQLIELVETINVWNKSDFKPEIMINIPDFPKWMRDSKGKLKKEFYSDYASLCAELISYLTNSGMKISYVEILNEKDLVYDNKADELAKIYLDVAKSIRQVNSKIKIGGMATMRLDKYYNTEKFINFIYDQKGEEWFDFYSYHYYPTKNTTDSESKILQNQKKSVEHARKVKELLLNKVKNDKIPNIILSEYNISASWESHDPRMHEIFGAIYDTINNFQHLEGGVYSTMAWNDADDVYGKMDENYNMRIGGEVMQIVNQIKQGNLVKVNNPFKDIDAYAVKSDKGKCLIIINPNNKEIPIELDKLNGKIVDRKIIDNNGINSVKDKSLLSIKSIQAESIYIINLN
jgi:hypothetical protein